MVVNINTIITLQIDKRGMLIVAKFRAMKHDRSGILKNVLSLVRKV